MRYIFSVLCVLLGLACSSIAQAVGVTNYEPLTKSDYWIKNNPSGNTVLLDDKGIKNFNSSIQSISRTVVDLANYPDRISGDSLKTRVADYQLLEDELFLNGKKISPRYKELLRNLTNVNAISNVVENKYAVVVRRTNVRNLPTGQGLYYYDNDTEFDVLQETVLDPGEPVIVQHQSSNGWFYFVQAYNYYGWVSKLDIALTDKQTWLQYVKPKNFIVVTSKNLLVGLEKEKLLLQQGAKLPVYKESNSSYTLDIPQRNLQTNQLEHLHKTLSKQELKASVHKGYMPYTSNNILKAAFEHYSMPYGWGGLKNSVDCSALIADVYRTVGIILPRNADEQASTAGKYYPLNDMNSQLRNAQILRLMPGATLYMDGHIMMYVGSSNNKPFVIHCLGSHYVNGQRSRTMKVVVSDLGLYRSNGNSFLDELLTCAEYK